ncbi:hypothetical protein HD599_001966 [Conyzicola lurida]|uniref:Integral membrane protein n=1 Tax=Conyzicola lurida TaxID=1172621 RepID=A0A841APX4_9MICO|nr:hypothetical protein [Conyzicola lurida]MBB5843643.1 hypothetical protein [Conyzicola lurida]
MNVAIAAILFLTTVFNLVTWPTFFRRVAKDPRARTATGKATPFFTVHLVLLIIGLTLAVASAVAGVALLVA